MSRPSYPQLYDDPAVRSMLAEGLSQAEIGRRLGITRNAVHHRVKLLRAAGLLD